MKKLLLVLSVVALSTLNGMTVSDLGVFTKKDSQVTILLEGTSTTAATFVIVTPPTSGTLSVITPVSGPFSLSATVVYMPNAGFTGLDSFTYNFQGGSDPATVTIAVLTGNSCVDLAAAIRAKYIQFCLIPV